jgi:hypothetical protein
MFSLLKVVSANQRRVAPSAEPIEGHDICVRAYLGKHLETIRRRRCFIDILYGHEKIYTQQLIQRERERGRGVIETLTTRAT